MDMILSSKFFCRLLLCFVTVTFSAMGATGYNQVKYKTIFGSCPSRPVGILALKLVKEFEQKNSLSDVKKFLVNERLSEKYFITDYSVSYDPIARKLNFQFQCPKPLMKVQIYKDNGMESYTAILVENAELFDPTYEVLLRGEGKIEKELPMLALPVGELEQPVRKKVADLIAQTDIKFRQQISEVIISENKELTIILSDRNRPSSAFFGKHEWKEKIDKLEKIMSFMHKKRKIPSIVNLTNLKKVVVKF